MKSKKPGLLYVLFSFSTACAMLYLLGAHALRKVCCIFALSIENRVFFCACSKLRQLAV